MQFCHYVRLCGECRVTNLWRRGREIVCMLYTHLCMEANIYIFCLHTGFTKELFQGWVEWHWMLQLHSWSTTTLCTSSTRSGKRNIPPSHPYPQNLTYLFSLDLHLTAILIISWYNYQGVCVEWLREKWKGS